MTLTKFGLYCAKYSFITGSVLLVINLINRETIFYSIAYFIIALAVNAVMILVLLASLLLNNNNHKNVLLTIGVILLNIPITIIYALLFNFFDIKF